MKFKIFCTRPVVENDELKNMEIGLFHYDNMTSILYDKDMNEIPFTVEKQKTYKDVVPTSPENPAGKGNIRTLKIQLGLSCNFSCEYCSQRFVPHAPETNPTAVTKFMESLDSWLTTIPQKIEFWGGEPLVYIKTLKPLSIKLREKFPKAKFVMITNGSLLTDEIIDWIDELDIMVGVSHDGPGQAVRGPDPLDDPEQRKNIIKLFERRAGKVAFNAMVHRENLNREEIQDFFSRFFGHDRFVIGEGGFIDTYDEGGDTNSLKNYTEHLALRRMTVHQIREGKIDHFSITPKRINEWVESISHRRSADALGQKCGMDQEDQIAVDLRGNVLTCQNVSAVSTAPNGRPHMIGHVSDLSKVRLRTATHWKFREECSKCPVLQMCKGSCMFLQGERFQTSCDNAYSDHIPFMAAAIEWMTGWLPFRIEAIDHELPEERKNLWGDAKDVGIIPTRRKK